MDQFATGLVGTRSPYGVPRNKFNEKLIPGGSSSGSGTAVSHGLCTFSLGTDTAGSGRVPAGLNNLIGFKPSKNLLSTDGVLPACKSLDCVSIFANNINDARYIFTNIIENETIVTERSKKLQSKMEILSSHQALNNGYGNGNGYTVGIPKNILDNSQETVDYYFCGNFEYAEKYAEMIETVQRNINTSGGSGNNRNRNRNRNRIVEVDFEQFFTVGKLLYEHPWVAERLAALPFFDDEEKWDNMKGLDPTVREIISKTRNYNYNATQVFSASYTLQELRRNIETNIWDKYNLDILCVPTIPRSYTIDEINKDAIKCNSNLGRYTNFVNLLDLCAIVIPTRLIEYDTYKEPCSVTLISRKFNDLKIMAIGRDMLTRYSIACG